MFQDPVLPPRGTGQRILVVDDEVDILELLSMFLDGHGYSVEAYTSSSKALARLEANPGEVDLVLTDLMMPAIGGVDIARKIQELRPELPVLLITGHRRALERCGELPQAVREVLLKPFDLAGLVRSISKYVPQGL